MPGFTEDIATLTAELTRIEELLGSLAEADWAAPTRLEPPEPGQPRWTVRELAGHLGMGMSMLGDLLAGETRAEPQQDRIGFFQLPAAEVDPVIFRLAREVTVHRTPADVLGYYRMSFRRPLRDAEGARSRLVGPTVAGLMRLAEFVPTRIVEAVVHGLDLAAAVNRDFQPSDRALTTTADIFDGLLRARDGRDRPAGLSDDAKWIQVASGRLASDDLPAPLLG